MSSEQKTMQLLLLVSPKVAIEPGSESAHDGDDYKWPLGEKKVLTSKASLRWNQRRLTLDVKSLNLMAIY